MEGGQALHSPDSDIETAERGRTRAQKYINEKGDFFNSRNCKRDFFFF